MNMLPTTPTIEPISAMPASMSNPAFTNQTAAMGGSAQPVTGKRPTAIYGAVRDASGQLRQHINSCKRSAGPLHHVHCFFELMYETVATRLVTTTVLLLAGVMAINALV